MGEIKKAFRGLARELHPDVNDHDPAAEERFKEAAEAYEVLSDVERRRTYDAYGHDGLRQGGFQASGFGGGLGDIFETIFGGDAFGRGPAAGVDIGTAVEIELEDVLDGAAREVSFEAVSVCEHCRGNGAEPGTPIHTCETCEGTGQVREVRPASSGRSSGRRPATAAAATAASPTSRAATATERAASRRPASGRWTSRPGSRMASESGSRVPGTPETRGPGRATSTSRSACEPTSVSRARAPSWSAALSCP